MIYTIGHRENYWQAILNSENGFIVKTRWYAFRSVEDAQRMIDGLANLIDLRSLVLMLIGKLILSLISMVGGMF